MSTVKDLIEYLKTKDPNASVICQYDGSYHDLNVFEHKRDIVFTKDTLNVDYEDVKVEFTTEE
jgi:hypothetical protein